MRNTLITLAEIHYEFGLIGHDELRERIRVALWLADEIVGRTADPRTGSEKKASARDHHELEQGQGDEQVAAISRAGSGSKYSKEDDKNWMEFICLGTWVFTKADPDSYPSVPHGHYRNQNIKWPKLNPYTGRVFSSKHQEDASKRLSKKQMKEIWSDESFKSFCREMIIWYREMFPYYEFPVSRVLRMPKY